MSSRYSVISVDILDKKTVFTLRDLCEHGGVHAKFVIELVDYGVINPMKDSPPQQWCFDVHALLRLEKAERLQRDLHLNMAGLAMCLELLDEIDSLEKDREHLRKQLQSFSTQD